MSDSRKRKHRIAERWTVFPINGLAKESWEKGTKKISRCARNDSVGDGYPVHHTKNVWEKHVSRIVIGSGAEGSFSLAVRRSVFDSEERETPCRGKAGAVLPVNGLAKKSWKKGTKKISRCARNDSVGDGYSVHHTKNVWEKHVSRIVIGSEVEGSFSLAVRRRVSDGEKRETPYRRKADGVSRIVIGSGAEGSFSLVVRRRASDGEKWETPYRGKWKRRVSRIVIPSEVEGSFSLAVRRRVFEKEKWETLSHGKADGVSRKRLSEGGGKRGTEKISRCARNDSVGDGYPVHHTKNVWEKHVSRIVIGSGAEGSFSLAVRRRASDGEKWETPYRGKWKRRVSRIVIPSEVEGSFSLTVRRSVFDSEERETPCRGKAGAVLSVKGLAKEEGKRG